MEEAIKIIREPTERDYLTKLFKDGADVWKENGKFYIELMKNSKHIKFSLDLRKNSNTYQISKEYFKLFNEIKGEK